MQPTRFEVLTPPGAPVIDLDDLKVHLRIDADDENTLLAYFIEETRHAMEDVLRHVGIETQYRQYHYGFADALVLSWGPVKTIDEIRYLDESNAPVVVSPTVYELVPGQMPPVVRLQYQQEWPTDVRRHPDSVQVDYTAGYSDSEAGVPEWFKALCRKYAGHLYENREASQNLGRGEKEATAMRLAFESDVWARTARPLV